MKDWEGLVTCVIF